MMSKKILCFLIICLITIIVMVGCGFYFLYEPKITLFGDDIVYVDYDSSYVENGATISFLFDVDRYIEIEGAVDTHKVGDYTLKYHAKLPFLYQSIETKRIVKVIDKEKPIITLKGSNVSMYVGDAYKEPGYVAYDSVDGDLTEDVTIESNVDVKKKGSYKVTYMVKDKSGNEYQVERDVEVKVRPTTKPLGQALPILMYHYFYDPSKGEEGKNSNYMSIAAFDEQMKYLVDNNYYFPTWSEVADFIVGKKKLPKKSVVVTIDDGQASLFNYAIPILNKYHVKATAFIITSKSAGTKFRKYLFDNISYESHTHAMHTGGCSGGHGGLFRCISYEKGLEDLKTSISILGSSDAIAYPYGDVTDNVLKITKEAGFKVGVTTINRKAQVGMDPLELPRVRMSKGMSLKTFISLL